MLINTKRNLGPVHEKLFNAYVSTFMDLTTVFDFKLMS